MTRTKRTALTALTVAVVIALAFMSAGLMFTGKASADTARAGGITANTSGARVAYGPGWGAEAAEEVNAAFDAALDEYTVTDAGSIQILKATSDGDAVGFAMSCKKDGEDSYLAYNVLDKKVYLIPNKFQALFVGESRRIGMPVTNELTGIKVTGTDGENNNIDLADANVQVFETGMIVIENGTAKKHEGLVEKISDTEYAFLPLVKDQDVMANKGSGYGFVGDIDGTWHALRTARNTRLSDGKLKVEYNFRAGCIEFIYNTDYTISSRMAYAGQNYAYDASGNSTRVTLPYENFTTDEHLFENSGSSFNDEGGGSNGVSNNALTMFKNLSGNANASRDDVKAAFKTGYFELLDAGIVPGYRCSVIKTWDVICVDYKYSPDSMYGFSATGSAARERMYTLVYSGAQKKVYGVGGEIWNAWREDKVRRALGAPISNELTDVTISGMTFSCIQIFEQGYVYLNEKGAISIEYGATSNGEYTEFIYTAAPPEKPDKYGAETERFEAVESGRKVVYINYARGAVKATEMNAKVGYGYKYLPGRNFKAQGETYVAELLPYDALYSDSDYKCADYFIDKFNGGIDNETGEFVTGVKVLIKEKIEELLEQGFFPGFFEDQFKSWNGVSCQQFIYGDSTAQPWGGDTRTEVCAFIYNDDMKKIFLLKDAFMDLWGGESNGYVSLGAPAGEEFTLEGDPNVKFQYFYGTSTMNNKAFAVSVGYNEATYFIPSTALVDTVNPAQYLKDLDELRAPLSGVEIDKSINTNVTVGGYALLEYVISGASADATIVVTSSDDSIGEVKADGSVEFYKAGTVTITVSVSDGVNTFSDSITFTVGKGKAAVGMTRDIDSGIIGGISALVGLAAIVAATAVTVTVMRKKRENA